MMRLTRTKPRDLKVIQNSTRRTAQNGKILPSPTEETPTFDDKEEVGIVFIYKGKTFGSKTKKKIAPESVLTPPSTPSSPLNEEDIEVLHKSWYDFKHKPNGDVDETIVVFKPEKELPEGFVPFNIDKYMAVKLLKELNIDTKYADF